MSKLDRSLTNIDWLVSFSPEKQPIKKQTHYCGSCLHCSRLKSRPKTAQPPPIKPDPSGPPPAPLSPSKPSHSYANIIVTAIKQSANQRMTLNEIYSSVREAYPYFKTSNAGWKNSIRHNLSLNKLFLRVARPKGESGKGAYWEVDQKVLELSKRSPKSPKKKELNVPVAPLTQEPDPYFQFPAPWGPFMPPLCPLDTPNQLNQSFTAFYRSLMEVQRLESDVAESGAYEESAVPLSSLRETMDTFSRADDLANLDVSRFEELVSSLNPGYGDKESGELFMNLKDSFSNFLRELSVSGTNSRLPELEMLPKHFSNPQELYSSNEPSSQEFDWNAIL